ncbi:hypothetical protein QFZ79_000087 [Arthrobacter sp. V4I6]|nr:hypothetical protein [Arthrobacter sp. V1I7]MDQ0851976.1 hypothetical protein [Arthrobacter sp. V4I6]
MHPDIKIRHLVATWPDDAERGAVKQHCRRHKVSRAWFYKLRAAAAAVGPVKAMETASIRPAASPAQIDASLAQLALATRESLRSLGYDHGPLSVAAKLRRQGGPASITCHLGPDLYPGRSRGPGTEEKTPQRLTNSSIRNPTDAGRLTPRSGCWPAKRGGGAGDDQGVQQGLAEHRGAVEHLGVVPARTAPAAGCCRRCRRCRRCGEGWRPASSRTAPGSRRRSAPGPTGYFHQVGLIDSFLAGGMTHHREDPRPVGHRRAINILENELGPVPPCVRLPSRVGDTIESSVWCFGFRGILSVRSHMANEAGAV